MLLKGLSAAGFVFFTNTESRKAQHMAANARVCLHFVWLAMDRQVIINGRAEALPKRDVVRYFAGRPRESQLAAWASRQSYPITARRLLADGVFTEAGWQRSLEERYERLPRWAAGPEPDRSRRFAEWVLAEAVTLRARLTRLGRPGVAPDITGHLEAVADAYVAAPDHFGAFTSAVATLESVGSTDSHKSSSLFTLSTATSSGTRRPTIAAAVSSCWARPSL